jgi:hypothetical protein
MIAGAIGIYTRNLVLGRAVAGYGLSASRADVGSAEVVGRAIAQARVWGGQRAVPKRFPVWVVLRGGVVDDPNVVIAADRRALAPGPPAIPVLSASSTFAINEVALIPAVLPRTRTPTDVLRVIVVGTSSVSA